jgi:hypothetical protein
MFNSNISISIILDTFNPIQHALLNISKTVLIILLIKIFGKPFITSFNFFFCMLCFVLSILSVHAINNTPEKEQEPKREKETLRKSSIKCILPSICVIGLFLVGVLSCGSKPDCVFERVEPAESKPEKSAKQTWTECIEDIQGSIIRYDI